LAKTFRSLPVTELVNNCGLAKSEQIASLSAFIRPPGKLPSYAVAKRAVIEAIGAVGPMLPPSTPLRGEDLCRFVLNLAKGDKGVFEFNWPIVSALSAWADSSLDRAIFREMDPANIVGHMRRDLVCSAIPVIGGVGYLLAIDPRRNKGLTPRGIFVLQSLIHHLYRLQYVDISELDIVIAQFPEKRVKNPDGSTSVLRKLVCHTLGEKAAMPWSDLSSGIAETAAIFESLLRQSQQKSTGTEG
jgi:hypothetical protein